MEINITETTLSDGSHVFDLQIDSMVIWTNAIDIDTAEKYLLALYDALSLTGQAPQIGHVKLRRC